MHEFNCLFRRYANNLDFKRKIRSQFKFEKTQKKKTTTLFRRIKITYLGDFVR